MQVALVKWKENKYLRTNKIGILNYIENQLNDVLNNRVDCFSIYQFSDFYITFKQLMFKVKTQPSSPTNCSLPICQFKQRAGNLLTKIEGIHSQIQQNKLIKFKQLLNEISSIEQNVEGEVREQKRLYEVLLNKIKTLNEEAQEQLHISEKTAVLVKNRIEAFSKANQKAFQKLKLERLQTQQRLQKYLDSKLQGFYKKYPQISSNACSVSIPENLTTYHNNISAFRTQLSDFFSNCEAEEQMVKEQIYSAIQQCSNLIQDREIDDVESEAIQFMRLIHSEIEGKLFKLGQQRLKTEEDVLLLLQRISDSITKDIGATDFLQYARQYVKND